MSEEEKLVGGNVSDSVVRIGSTVRKPATVATPAVQALLTHLHSVGFAGAPQGLGLDERGRQVFEFIPGAMWDRKQQNTLADLRRVGALIRSLHDATASFTPPRSAEWNTLSVPDGHDILCHNDLAPWNLVCGADRWAFIDWDNAAPGTRLWDLAWATISFPPVEPDCDLSVAATAIHAIVEGYRLPPSEYGKLLRLMATRARAGSDLLVQGARTGQQPWVRLYAEGHDKYWGPVSNYIDRSASILEGMLVSLSAG
ncbi:phosphotransferase enzyme family protein [Granulicella mallensis]|jgi:Ser/Thr protein kinase RdoA (MazF antagonist)|uniref:Ser/Thr protein kinase RdoA (MazF antagonist) n=1 Tax=Granulicella mallensis TaxID=940614 RepID=A0A7W7ZTQ9_9BACT|nr:phosphotransferase [Granulicella mallensis]MBB5065931.1 Ser/Thr protein kinase RdoA (MazF antagonist) [Granulicella mallensis]